MVEGPPFWTTVNKIIIDYKTTVLAYELCTLVIVDELPAATFGANRLGVVLRLLFVFLDTFLDSLSTGPCRGL